MINKEGKQIDDEKEQHPTISELSEERGVFLEEKTYHIFFGYDQDSETTVQREIIEIAGYGDEIDVSTP